MTLANIIMRRTLFHCLHLQQQDGDKELGQHHHHNNHHNHHHNNHHNETGKLSFLSWMIRSFANVKIKIKFQTCCSAHMNMNKYENIEHEQI